MQIKEPVCTCFMSPGAPAVRFGALTVYRSLNFEAATQHSCSCSSCCRGFTGRKEHPGASYSSDSLPHPVPDQHFDVRKGILYTDGCSVL
eukprot:1156608-Pelagomonas_calceolata.AAC.9